MNGRFDSQPHPHSSRPRTVLRERMEFAAMAMAAAPHLWEEIAAKTRQALGLAPSEVSAETPVHFIEERTAEWRRCLPVDGFEEIGRGGFNTVYRTRDRILHVPFAVRERHSARSAAEAEYYLLHDRIIEERLRHLRTHPVIPACYGRVSINGRTCELYDYAPGVNLRSYVARRGLTYGAILEVAYGAALGLKHLHGHRIVHADIKPENFCAEERQRRDGRIAVRVSLIDFDIATTPEDLVASYILGTTFAGTPAYMPPENFGTNVPEDPGEQERMAYAKDIYALGLTLCQIVTGSVPPLVRDAGRTAGGTPTGVLERQIEIPTPVPREFRDLVIALCRSNWKERPAIREVVLEIRRLRRRTGRDILDHLVVEPRPRVLQPTFWEALAAGPAIGPYLVVNPRFEVREAPEKGAPGTIAELEDSYGRRLLGVPFTFAAEKDATSFYEERCRLLEDLNGVRRLNPELFSGTFRDLVRTQDSATGPFHVWFIRPLLPKALALDEFLSVERGLRLSERVAILRRVAQALAALESAGYVHQGIGPRSVFFVPYPLLDSSITEPNVRTVAKQRDLFSVRASRPYHQELMGMADVRRASPDEFEKTTNGLLQIAAQIGVLDALSGLSTDVLTRLETACTWKERARILRSVEQGLEGARPQEG